MDNQEYSTHSVELHIPHCFHTKVQKKGYVQPFKKDLVEIIKSYAR